MLGLKLVVNTVAGLSLQQAFKHVPNMERFWDASAATAEISAMLVKSRSATASAFARKTRIPSPCSRLRHPDADDSLPGIPRHPDPCASQETSLSFTDIEDQAISLNHAMVGAELAEDWLLPAKPAWPFRHHHDIAALNGKLDIPLRSRRLIAVAQLAEHLIQERPPVLRRPANGETGRRLPGLPRSGCRRPAGAGRHLPAEIPAERAGGRLSAVTKDYDGRWRRP